MDEEWHHISFISNSETLFSQFYFDAIPIGRSFLSSPLLLSSPSLPSPSSSFIFLGGRKSSENPSNNVNNNNNNYNNNNNFNENNYKDKNDNENGGRREFWTSNIFFDEIYFNPSFPLRFDQLSFFTNRNYNQVFYLIFIIFSINNFSFLLFF